MSDGHRHATDRTDATIIAECPNISEDRYAHLSVEVSCERSDADSVVDELLTIVPECGECGAELDILGWREPTEVLE